jgi:hypothetical protein
MKFSVRYEGTVILFTWSYVYVGKAAGTSRVSRSNYDFYN